MSTYVRRLATKNSGFTIVELTVVVAVIAILAAVTVVAYQGIQARANDATVKTAAENFATALKQYSVRNSPPSGFGWGSTGPVTDGVCTGGNNGGWAQPNTYQCAIGDVMLANDYLPSNFFTELPKNEVYNSNRYVFMLYRCGGGNPANRYLLYYSLQNPNDQDDQQYIENANMCGISSPHAAAQYDRYGMRGSLVVDLD